MNESLSSGDMGRLISFIVSFTSCTGQFGQLRWAFCHQVDGVIAGIVEWIAGPWIRTVKFESFGKLIQLQLLQWNLINLTISFAIHERSARNNKWRFIWLCKVGHFIIGFKAWIMLWPDNKSFVEQCTSNFCSSVECTHYPQFLTYLSLWACARVSSVSLQFRCRC